MVGDVEKSMDIGYRYNLMRHSKVQLRQVGDLPLSVGL